MPSRAKILSLRETILDIAARHGAHDVRLFGSIARDEGRTASDLDLLVHMDPDRSLLDRIALTHELEDLIHCKVDIVNEQALDPLLREDVLAGAVVL